MTTTTHHNTNVMKAQSHKRSLRAYLLRMISLNRQRKALQNLDEHMLRDIGISRQEAEIESKKHFWDAPQHWFH